MIKKYGIWGAFRLSINLVLTKIFFPNARIIRFPFDIRNKRFIQIASGMTTGIGCRIEAFPHELKEEGIFISIGKNFQMNDYVHIAAVEKITIGENVLIASKVFITDCAHGNYGGGGIHSHPDEPPANRKWISKPVIIRDNVWLGEFVSVLPGVTIGKGTIVGSNSVVSKSLPDHVIAVGSPARPIKKFNFESNTWEKIV
ncbi:hypothetical protein ACLOAU_17720 [Niabella sp. CJ426]|uniref:hypothetical protein n=1 Tax=Niabella sp. CJ426 TaxID=3393740 RepID=UPI003D02B5B7